MTEPKPVTRYLFGGSRAVKGYAQELKKKYGVGDQFKFINVQVFGNKCQKGNEYCKDHTEGNNPSVKLTFQFRDNQNNSYTVYATITEDTYKKFRKDMEAHCVPIDESELNVTRCYPDLDNAELNMIKISLQADEIEEILRVYEIEKEYNSNAAMERLNFDKLDKYIKSGDDAYGRLSKSVKTFQERVRFPYEARKTIETYRSLKSEVKTLKDEIFFHYYNSGTVNEFAGKFKDALEDFKKAAEIDPSFRSSVDLAYSKLAVAASDQGRNQDALDYYDKLIKYNPKSTLGYAGRGLENIYLANVKAARRDYRKLSSIYPDKHVYSQTLTALSFTPDFLQLGTQLRHRFAGLDLDDFRIGVGISWLLSEPIYDEETELQIGPKINIGYGGSNENHQLDLSVGALLRYKFYSSVLLVHAGVGYNIALAGDGADNPLSEGGFFSYGINYNYLVSKNSLGVGASLMLQHPFLKPSKFVLLPGIEMTYSF